MPNLLGHIATTPIHNEIVFGLSNEQSQATQIQAHSADLLRPAVMASPTKMSSTATIANSTDKASPAMTGGPIDTASFAAKVKDKATRRKPLLTVDTARSNKTSAKPAASSSAHGQSVNDYGISETGEDLNIRPGLTDTPTLTPQKAYKDEVSIHTHGYPIINEFETACLEVGSSKDVMATGKASTATTEPSPSMSPAKFGKSFRWNFAHLKPAKSDSTSSKSDTNKGALHSPKEAGPGPSATTGNTSNQASPISPSGFQIPRKSVGSGDARAVSSGLNVQKTAQSSQEESSKTGAQAKAKQKESANARKAKAKLEREDFVTFKVSYHLVLHHCD